MTQPEVKEKIGSILHQVVTIDGERYSSTDHEDFIQELLDLFNEQMEEVIPKKLENPKPIKQEIWGGEQGLGNTTIISPNVFGQKYVDGFNACVNQIISSLTRSEETK